MELLDAAAGDPLPSLFSDTDIIGGAVGITGPGNQVEEPLFAVIVPGHFQSCSCLFRPPEFASKTGKNTSRQVFLLQTKNQLPG